MQNVQLQENSSLAKNLKPKELICYKRHPFVLEGKSNEDTDKESMGSARGNTCEKFPAMTVHMCRRGGTCRCEVPPSGTPVSGTWPSGWPGQSSQTSLRETSASSLQHLAWDPRRPSVDVVRRWQLCSGLPLPWAWSYTALPWCSACSDKTHNSPKHLREKQPIGGKVCAATRANTTHSQMASFSHAQKG